MNVYIVLYRRVGIPKCATLLHRHGSDDLYFSVFLLLVAVCRGAHINIIIIAHTHTHTHDILLLLLLWLYIIQTSDKRESCIHEITRSHIAPDVMATLDSASLLYIRYTHFAPSHVIIYYNIYVHNIYIPTYECAHTQTRTLTHTPFTRIYATTLHAHNNSTFVRATIYNPLGRDFRETTRF